MHFYLLWVTILGMGHNDENGAVFIQLQFIQGGRDKTLDKKNLLSKCQIVRFCLRYLVNDEWKNWV